MKLDFHIPTILGRLHTTYLLIAIQNHPNYNQWLCENCIQVGTIVGYDDTFDYSILDGIITNNINKLDNHHPLLTYDLFECGNNSKSYQIAVEYLISVLTDRLNEGYYICMHFDDFFIPDKWNYNIRHDTHINLIYGYDNCKKVVYSFGYDYSGVCREMEIPYGSIVNGYINADPERKTIIFIKSDFNNTYALDLEYLKNNLECYINPNRLGELVNQGKRLSRFTLIYKIDSVQKSLLFGHVAQKYIINRIKEAINNSDSIAPFLGDMRTFQTLIEHRTLMDWRIGYLIYLNMLNSEYRTNYSEKILKPSLPLKNLMIKYKHTKNINILYRVAQIWEDTLYNEKELITNIIIEL